MARFTGAGPEEPDLEEETLAQTQDEKGGAEAFISKFGGITDSTWFYDHTVEIKFDKVEHKYFRVGDLGELVLLFNVSTVSKIIDRSPALIPWAAKVTVEKLLRIIPTIQQDGDPPTLIVPPMPFDKFSALALEAKKAHTEHLEEAGDIGKMAHDFLEKYILALIGNDYAAIQGMMAQMCPDERATNCVIAALDWMKAHNVRWISTERKVYSKKYDCCGTLDGLCLTDSCTDPSCCPKPFKDRRTLLDWKTSNYLYIEFIYQASAYKAFYLEEFPNEVIDDIWILRLGKEDGEFQPWHLYADTFESDFAGFVACLELKKKATELELRMRDEKAKIKAKRKEVRAEEKAKAKIEAKAQKKAEREKLKAERAAEREKLKAEAKAEREKLRAEKKADKETLCTSSESTSLAPSNQTMSTTKSMGLKSDTMTPKETGTLSNAIQNQSTPEVTPENLCTTSTEETKTPDALNIEAKLERAGVITVEEPKPIFTRGILIEEETVTRPIFSVPVED